MPTPVLTVDRYYIEARHILRRTQLSTLNAEQVLLEHANLQIKSEQLPSDYPMHENFLALCSPDSQEIEALCYSMTILNRVALELENPLKFFQEYLATVNYRRLLDKSFLNNFALHKKNVVIFGIMTDTHHKKIKAITHGLRFTLQMQTAIWNTHVKNLQTRLKDLAVSFAKPVDFASYVQPGISFTPTANNAVRRLPPYVRPLPPLPPKNIAATEEIESSSDEDAFEDASSSDDSLSFHMWKQQYISNRRRIR